MVGRQICGLSSGRQDRIGLSHAARQAHEGGMKPMTSAQDRSIATPEQRAEAIEIVLRRKGEMPETFVADFTDHAEEAWITDNGARMVARAWTDPAFRARMLADGKTAAEEMGFEFPEHHRHLVVLEKRPDVPNVIV